MNFIKSASTPWGISIYSEKIAPGIMLYTTKTHGGIHLSEMKLKELLKRKHECKSIINLDYDMKRGWFEEDNNWAFVPYAFPEYFNHGQIDNAIKILKYNYPKTFNIKLTAAEIYVDYENALNTAITQIKTLYESFVDDIQIIVGPVFNELITINHDWNKKAILCKIHGNSIDKDDIKRKLRQFGWTVLGNKRKRDGEEFTIKL